MIQAVIFDFNGVLVDDEVVHFELFREVLAQEGVVITDRDYHERYLGYDDRGCFAAALGDAGQAFDHDRLDALIVAEGPALCRGRRAGPALLPVRGRDPDRHGIALAGRHLLGSTPFGDRVCLEAAELSRPGCGHRCRRGRPQVQARPGGLSADPGRPAGTPPVHDSVRTAARSASMPGGRRQPGRDRLGQGRRDVGGRHHPHLQRRPAPPVGCRRHHRRPGDVDSEPGSTSISPRIPTQAGKPA